MVCNDIIQPSERSILIQPYGRTASTLIYFFNKHCSAFAEGTILDSHQLICLHMLSQLLERELEKCLRLVVAIPMDMSTFYGKTHFSATWYKCLHSAILM